MQRQITAPLIFDGYHLKQHIYTETGINVCPMGLVYNDGNLYLPMMAFTEEQGDDIEAAIGTYVHPVDTSKNMLDVIKFESGIM